MDHQRGLDDSPEVRARHRIEVEVKVVGTIDVVAARVPLVQVDAAEVDDPEQRRQILHDRKVDDIAGPVLDRAELDPLRTGRGRALHEEELPRRAVRVAFHHHRAIAQVRQQHAGDLRVVLEQVALGQAGLRPEDLAKVGQPDVFPVNGQDDVVLTAGNSQRLHRVARVKASRENVGLTTPGLITTGGQASLA